MPCAARTSAKDVADFGRTSAVSGTKHFNFHILQAPFSPKAFHRAAEDTISKRGGQGGKKTKDFYRILQEHGKFFKYLGNSRKWSTH